MRKIIGGLVILLAIAMGVYVGIWLCFIGGTYQIIEAIKADFIAIDIAIGLAKILFGVPAAELLAFILLVGGRELIK